MAKNTITPVNLNRISSFTEFQDKIKRYDNHFSLDVATHPHAHRDCKSLIEVCHRDFIDDDMWDGIANLDNRFDQLLEDNDGDVELALVDVIDARYEVWCDWCEETDEEGRELLEKAGL